MCYVSALTLFESNVDLADLLLSHPQETLEVFDKALLAAVITVYESEQNKSHLVSRSLFHLVIPRQFQGIVCHWLCNLSRLALSLSIWYESIYCQCFVLPHC